MNLYLDDCRPCPEGWVCARTLEKAKELLQSGDVEDCSLDHDLGCCAHCEAARCVNSSYPAYYTGYCSCKCHETGYDLVKWMAENKVWPKNKPTVHSDNPPGRLNMLSVIERYGPY